MARIIHYAAALSLLGALVMAAPAAAQASTDSGTECTAQHVNESGTVTGTSAENEGVVYGPFHCTAGEWRVTWSPYGPDDVILSAVIQVDPAGNATAVDMTTPWTGGYLTMAQGAALAEAVTGRTEAVIQRAVVIADDGKERTPDDVQALLAGKDTTGARVLATIDKPGLATTTKDLADQAGAMDPTVIYLSWGGIWGAIKSIINKIGEVIDGAIDGAGDAFNWLQKHCTWVVSPKSIGIRCQWTW